MTTPVFIDGELFKPVKIPATGEWQLLRMESVKSYVLVHPNGRQAWFSDNQMIEVSFRMPNFRYSDNPFNDLKRLIKGGLRPFHVDSDFDPTGLDTAKLLM